MLPLALAVSLAVASGEPAGSGPAGVTPPADSVPELRGWRQDVGLGLHSTTFWSHSDHQYTFHSLGLGYLASWGRRGVFVHATALLPLQGREDGRASGLGQYYGPRWGGDLLTGFQLRWLAWHGLEAQAGAGPHATFVVLKGITGYRDFSASPLGLGGEASLRWRTGRAIARWPLTAAVFGSAAVDFYDPFHGNDLRHGFTFRVGLALGLAPGGPR
jgi:hypothetical protein